MRHFRNPLAALWPADCGTYDGLPPPGAIVDVPDVRVDFVLMLLEHIAMHHAEDDPACDLSTAIFSLQEEATKRDGKRIHRRQRDKLLAALVWARAPILAMFASAAERRMATAGLNATGALICLWAEPHEQIADRRKRGVTANIDQYARWLRNACHNISICREIEAIAAERRSATVAEIMQKATAA